MTCSQGDSLVEKTPFSSAQNPILFPHQKQQGAVCVYLYCMFQFSKTLVLSAFPVQIPDSGCRF